MPASQEIEHVVSPREQQEEARAQNVPGGAHRDVVVPVANVITVKFVIET